MKMLKQRWFKSVSSLVLSLCLIFSTVTVPVTVNADEANSNKLSISIEGNFYTAHYLFELQKYNTEADKWEKIAEDGISQLPDGNYAITYSVEDAAVFRLAPGPLEMDIKTTTNVEESGNGYIVTGDRGSVDVSLSLPDGDLWIGDTGYAIGNYNADSFAELGEEELVSREAIYICYDMDNKKIHDASSKSFGLALCKDVTVEAIVVEKVDESNSNNNVITLKNNVSGWLKFNVLNDFDNSKNNVVQKLDVGFGITTSFPKISHSKINLLNSNLYADKLGDLDSINLESGANLEVKGESSIKSGDVLVENGATVSAPGVEMISTDDICIQYSATARFKSLGGKNLTVYGGTKLYTDSFTDFEDMSVGGSAYLEVKGASSINAGKVTFDSGCTVIAPKLEIAASGNVDIKSAQKVNLKSIGGKNLTVYGGARLYSDSLNDFEDITVDGSAYLEVKDKTSITGGAVTITNSSTVSAPGVEIAATDDVMVQNGSTANLKSISGKNLTVQYAGKLYLDKLNNFNDISAKNTGWLEAKEASVITGGTIILDSSGTVSAPGVEISAAKDVSVKSGSILYIKSTGGKNLKLDSTGTLYLTGKIKNFDDISIGSGSRVIVDGESAITCGAITVEYSSGVSMPGVEVAADGDVQVKTGSEAYFKSISGKDLIFSDSGKVYTDALKDFDNITMQNGSYAEVKDDSVITCAAVTLNYGATLNAPGIDVSATGDVQVKNSAMLSLKSIGGKNLAVEGSGKLYTDTLKSFEDVTVLYSAYVGAKQASSVSCSSLKIISGGTVSASGVELDVKGDVDIENSAISNFKSISGNNLKIWYTGKLSTGKFKNFKTVDINYGSTLEIKEDSEINGVVTAEGSSVINAPETSLTTDKDLNFTKGVSVTLKSVNTNKLNLDDSGKLFAKDVNVDDIIDLGYGSGLYADDVVCKNVTQNAVSSLYVTGKLSISEGKYSRLHSAGINSFEIGSETALAGLLPKRVSAYSSTAYSVSGSANNCIVSGGVVKDYLKNIFDTSVSSSLKPVNIRPTYVYIKNKDFARANAYTGVAATGPSLENFETNNTEAQSYNWKFTWYDSDNNKIENIAKGSCPVTAGAYVLEVKISETENYPSVIERFPYTVYNDNYKVSVTGDSIKPESGWYTSNVAITVTGEGVKISETTGSAISNRLPVNKSIDGAFDYYIVHFGSYFVEQHTNLKVDLTLPKVVVELKDKNNKTVLDNGDNRLTISDGLYFSLTGEKEAGSQLDSVKVEFDGQETSLSAVDAMSVEVTSQAVVTKGKHTVSYEMSDYAGHIVTGETIYTLYEKPEVNVATSESVFYDGGAIEEGVDFTLDVSGNGKITYYYKKAGSADATYTKGLPSEKGLYTIKAEIEEDSEQYYDSAVTTFTVNIVYDVKKVEAKKATCVEAGNIEYYYVKAADKYFTDEECNNEVTAGAVLIAKDKHNHAGPVVTDAAVEATPEKPGLTEGSHCEACGKVIVAQKEVPYTNPGGNDEATPTPDGNEGTVPTPTPDGNEGTVPTPTPDGNEGTVPTPTPDGNDGTVPTPTPDGNDGTVPTPTPDGNGGTNPGESTPPVEDKTLPGDANEDGVVNLEDVVTILNTALGVSGKTLEPGTQAYKNADVDGSGFVDLTDCMAALKIALGIK